MLESKKLLGLSHQLVAFANDKKESSQYPFFTAEAPTLDYLKRVQHRCTLLAKWQPSKDAPTSVTTAAKQWLKELQRNRSKTLDAPSWLWHSVVDLVAAHEGRK